MLTIMLLRAFYVYTRDYNSPIIPIEWCSKVIAYGFVGKAVWQTTALEVVETMKINLFSHDFCTKVAAKIMSGTKQLRQQTLNAYLIAVCTSRDFLNAFLESEAYRTKWTIESKLAAVMEHLGPDNLYKCFTRSYNPQRRIRNTILLYRKEGKVSKMKSYFVRLFKRPPQLKLKNGKQWIRKVCVCNTIRKFRGLGVFGAKNFWQFFRLGKHRYSKAIDRSFGEVGPGARKGINLIFHYPMDMMIAASISSCSLFYSDQCEKIRQMCLRHPLLRVHPDDPPEVELAKLAVRKELETIEGTQFLICEHAKVVRWCVEGTIIYEYGYWSSYEQHDDQECQGPPQ